MIEFVEGKISLSACNNKGKTAETCLLYTSDAADDMWCVYIGGRRIIKKKIF